MSTNTILEQVLKDILRSIQPTRDDREMRQQAIAELKAVVQSVKTLRGANVEPFGSFVSDLFTRSGDLDISLDFPNSFSTTSAAKRRTQKLMLDLYATLRGTGGWYKVQFIRHARVPILKFVNRHNISCDISVDNLKGLMKSKCLHWISRIDLRFRNLLLLVKEWAKAHDINDPKKGTLNSYSYSLLVIFHFQTCVPAILPPLKEIYPANMVDDLSGIRDVAERHIEEICALNIARFKSDWNRPVNKSSLSELFVSFLAKFSDIDVKASNLAICPFTGEWEDKRTESRSQTKNYALFIEDPFELPQNSARAVSSAHLTKISELFVATHHKLVSGNLNRNSIITAVYGPQTTMPNARQQYQSHNISVGGHCMPRLQPPHVRPGQSTPLQWPPLIRPVQSAPLQWPPHIRPVQSAPLQQPPHIRPVQLPPTQLYQQFQNISLQSEPNTVTIPRARQRFAQPFRNQSQGVWRPRGNDRQEQVRR